MPPTWHPAPALTRTRRFRCVRRDAPPADLGRRDAHVHVAGAGRPRLQARSVLQAPYVELVDDPVRVTVHQDAPAFMARLVEAVGLEADLGVRVQGQQRIRCGPEDDGLPRHGEVDRQDHDLACRGERDAADAAPSQQVEALDRAERLQGVRAGGGLGSRSVSSGHRFFPSCHVHSPPPFAGCFISSAWSVPGGRPLRPEVPPGQGPSAPGRPFGPRQASGQRTLLIRHTPIEAPMATTAVAPNRVG